MTLGPGGAVTSDADEAATFRTMFIFNPPPEDPNGWGLTFEGFAEALRSREPDAFAEQWTSPVTGEALSFSFTTFAGEEAEGLVGVEPNGVAVKDCTSAEAAQFVHWLREAVLPEDAELEATITEGVEWQLPQISVPRTAAPDELETVLTARVEEILRYEEQQLG